MKYNEKIEAVSMAIRLAMRKGSSFDYAAAETIAAYTKVAGGKTSIHEGDIAYAYVHVDSTPDKDGWCYCSPFNHPDDIKQGLCSDGPNDIYQFFGQVFASPVPPDNSELLDASQWIVDTMCEGFCNDLPSRSTTFDGIENQCAACKSRIAIEAYKNSRVEEQTILDMYREAVNIDATMEGPKFMGCNLSALKRAYLADQNRNQTNDR
jgi:hypothetical protein